jgi:ribosomal protein S18 acetylase RimI-like enzyme
VERVTWSEGTKDHRAKLESFDCCPGCQSDVVRHPGDRRRCVTEWAHELQTYFRAKAIKATNSRARTHDQRLILLWDRDELVGAGAHYSEKASDTEFERRIDAYATALHVHGRKLSTGEYASRALLRALVNDITSRHSPRDFVILTALVHPDNEASRKCLRRYGFSEQGQEAPYLVYAATLQEAQNLLGVEPASDIDEFQGTD